MQLVGLLVPYLLTSTSISQYAISHPVAAESGPKVRRECPTT